MFSVDTMKAARNIKAKPFGRTPMGALAWERLMHGACGQCAHPIDGMKDELSVKEFYIGGMCQSCQDSTFGE